MEISLEHVKKICKIGYGDKCCRYLSCGKEFECLKHTYIKCILDERVKNKTINAKGDNCEGIRK